MLLLIFYFFCAKEKRTLPSKCIDGCNVPCVSGPHFPTSHCCMSRTAPITCPELLWIYRSRTEKRTGFSASPESTILTPFLILFVPLSNAWQWSHFRLSGLFSQHFFLPYVFFPWFDQTKITTKKNSVGVWRWNGFVLSVHFCCRPQIHNSALILGNMMPSQNFQ